MAVNGVQPGQTTQTGPLPPADGNADATGSTGVTQPQPPAGGSADGGDVSSPSDGAASLAELFADAVGSTDGTSADAPDLGFGDTESPSSPIKDLDVDVNIAELLKDGNHKPLTKEEALQKLNQLQAAMSAPEMAPAVEEVSHADAPEQDAQQQKEGKDQLTKDLVNKMQSEVANLKQKFAAKYSQASHGTVLSKEDTAEFYKTGSRLALLSKGLQARKTAEKQAAKATTANQKQIAQGDKARVVHQDLSAVLAGKKAPVVVKSESSKKSNASDKSDVSDRSDVATELAAQAEGTTETASSSGTQADMSGEGFIETPQSLEVVQLAVSEMVPEDVRKERLERAKNSNAGAVALAKRAKSGDFKDQAQDALNNGLKGEAALFAGVAESAQGASASEDMACMKALVSGGYYCYGSEERVTDISGKVKLKLVDPSGAQQTTVASTEVTDDAFKTMMSRNGKTDFRGDHELTEEGRVALVDNQQSMAAAMREGGILAGDLVRGVDKKGHASAEMHVG
ncbi:hypothetical protein K1X76_12130 [bacterium]|nr:hypothetical protein [bacterium]